MRDITERYNSAQRFLPGNAIQRVYNWFVRPQWIDGQRFWYRLRTRRGHEFIYVDPDRLERRLAFDHERLAALLGAALTQAVDPYALPFASIRYMDGNSAIEFDVDELTWTCSLDDYVLTSRRTESEDGSLVSPDGRWAVFVGTNNLWLRNMASGECAAHPGQRRLFCLRSGAGRQHDLAH
ncbi:MAG: hypothetical protein IPK19_21150 [Chloroflexi bacterium]|nr:hypothetical protein [Chloroflexota bacterium]